MCVCGGRRSELVVPVSPLTFSSCTPAAHGLSERFSLVDFSLLGAPGSSAERRPWLHVIWSHGEDQEGMFSVR